MKDSPQLTPLSNTLGGAFLPGLKHSALSCGQQAAVVVQRNVLGVQHVLSVPLFARHNSSRALPPVKVCARSAETFASQCHGKAM